MKIKLTCVLLLSVFSVSTFAGQDRGGGDLCEDRIKTVRDDISKWIKDGGAKNLKLPSDVSIGQYEDEMLNQISKAKIRCVGKGDVGYPVNVDGISKVCRFDISKKESLITCDFTKFQSMVDNDQYVLVHHEYAGLSNVEKPNGSDSDYSISNQLAGFLENQIVKKLVIKPSLPPVVGQPTTKFETLQVMYEKATELATAKDINQSELKQQCLIVESDLPDNAFGFFHFKIIEIKTEGNSDPVFPIAPKSDWYALFVGEGASPNRPMLSLMKTPYPSYVGKDLLVTQPYLSVMYKDSDNETSYYQGAKFYIRKSGSTVVFKRIFDSTKKISFGYCYQKDK